MIVDFPDNLPVNIKDVDLSGNHVRILDKPTPYMKLEKLTLRENGLESISVVFFSKVTSLKQLDLSYNKLNDLNLSSLTNLIHLDLAASGVKDELLKTRMFQYLVSLQSLILRKNNLFRIPASAFKGLENSLEHLDLSYNNFDYIPSEVSKLKYLSKLVLNHNSFGIQYEFILPTCFAELSNLKYLYLSSCGIKSMSKGAFSLITRNNLTVLDLSQNNFSYLNDSLRLMHIDLFNLSSSNIKTLSELDGVKIRHLSLNNCTYLFKNGSVLRETLQSVCTCELQRLDLSWNGIHTIEDGALFCLSALTSIHLDNNILGNESIQKDEFQKMRNLQTLSLNNNEFTSFDLPLLEHIKRTLKQLDLYDNQILGSKIKTGKISFPNLIALKITIPKVNITKLILSIDIKMPHLEILHIKQQTNHHRKCKGKGHTPYSKETPPWIRNTSAFEHLKELAIIGYQFKTQYDFERLLNFLSPNIAKLSLENCNIESTWLQCLNMERLNFYNLTYFDLSGNKFHCNCDLYEFKNWLKIDSKVYFPEFQKYECSSTTPESVFLLEYDLSRFSCYNKTMVICICLTTGTIVLVLFVSIVCYRRRYSVRFAWYWVKIKLRPNSHHYQPVPTSSDTTDFDVYVASNSNDFQWVKWTLIPNLENSSYAIRLCIKDRNFPVGGNVMEDIIEFIHASRKTLLILTPDFVLNEWNYFELQRAMIRDLEEKQDMIIPVLLKPIKDKDLPRLLREIQLRKGFIEWTEHPLGKELFWKDLVKAIQEDSTLSRYKDNEINKWRKRTSMTYSHVI
ncbi:toll-like receptor 2 type-2 [Antedon mediterranea]|uniref:toll-like receptor 2 type-2 n=1 Tax=Antedon mediterranea TaxID=105859 RepID=UPI003AF94306